jgi:geranylgeranyl diphosphate synthase type II
LEGKRTLILINLFQQCNSKELKKIKAYLALPIKERNHGTAAWILGLMHQYDCINYSKNIAKYMAGAAIKEFYSIFSRLPDSEDKSFIESIILYMINRDY